MFVEFAPRVAETDIEEMEMVWMGGAWGVDYPSYGDIILPMPPDPTPYLTPADPNAARREEIRAQIGALQAELDGMEG
ncbi:MAG TPA: hypothetical protein VE028_04110 [Nitratidesulfovibrio sp.]|nr:hypothetical protein [Nitratidesulfovibrio sp.]